MPKILQKYRVLFVEDDESTRDVTEPVIREMFPGSLDIAETGSEALKFFGKNYYDLVVLDLGLMESDGFRVTQAIRDQKDAKKDVFIVGISAYLDETVKKCCLKVGMNAIYDKPLSKEKCLDIKDKFHQRNQIE